MPFFTRGRFLVAAVVAALAVGCGGSDGRVAVRGKLVDGGQAFAVDPSKVKLPPGASALPPGTNLLQVVLTPAAGGPPQPAVVNAADGTFTVPGPDGKGISPGKYKVAVTGGAGGADYFGGKFAPEKTQIVRDVAAGEEIVIDISKPQG